MPRSFLFLSILLIMNGCVASKLDSSISNQSYHIGTEALSFDISDEGILDMKNWLNTDKTAYQAVVQYEKISNKTLRSVLKVLESNKIKYSLAKGSKANKVILTSAEIKPLECKGLGCNNAHNLLKMLSNDDQIISPKTSNNHYSFTFN